MNKECPCRRFGKKKWQVFNVYKCSKCLCTVYCLMIPCLYCFLNWGYTVDGAQDPECLCRPQLFLLPGSTLFGLDWTFCCHVAPPCATMWTETLFSHTHPSAQWPSIIYIRQCLCDKTHAANEYLTLALDHQTFSFRSENEFY